MAYERDVQAFDDRAATYEDGRHGQLHREISDRVVALTLRKARQLSEAPSPDAILDVGSGTGYVLRQLARNLPGTRQFTGVDAAPKMVTTARGATADDRIGYLHGTAENLPVDDGAYDLVVSTTSFDHWRDQARGIAECARALKPGGTLVLTDQFSVLLLPTLLTSGRKAKARTRARAGRLLDQAGLRDPEWHPCYAVIIASVCAVKPALKPAVR